MGLTERHLFEDEDVPENDEWALEDAVYNSLENIKSIKYPCGQYRINGCGLDFNQPKPKTDCYFYEETKDMGATIMYCCAQSEIEWDYCPCEKCDKYISNAEVNKIIREFIEKRMKNK